MSKKRWITFEARIDMLIDVGEETLGATVNCLKEHVQVALAEGNSFIRNVLETETQQKVEMDLFRIPPITHTEVIKQISY
ncbi:hypothetical protein [Paenibacillus agricola]|uniref:Uncharacterized protein n=1 Tax=Paenibacillus agricola TaxID=2716264 RepID=A0ABX0JLC4_9BACL|nr:hypothetical protein [Paenibacillus agricola]NHN34815.1 hypothetical protein [Paenibacillus agricola]